MNAKVPEMNVKVPGTIGRAGGRSSQDSFFDYEHEHRPLRRTEHERDNKDGHGNDARAFLIDQDLRSLRFLAISQASWIRDFRVAIFSPSGLRMQMKCCFA